jgi:hypothetical protein
MLMETVSEPVIPLMTQSTNGTDIISGARDTVNVTVTMFVHPSSWAIRRQHSRRLGRGPGGSWG